MPPNPSFGSVPMNTSLRDGNIIERFPVRIYSQKQLFALAQEPNALLTVIDDDQSVHAAGSERRMNQLANEYLSMRIGVRAAEAQASELPNIQASLNDVRRKLEVLQKGGHAQMLSAYRTRRQINDTWNVILDATRKRVEIQ